MIQISKVFERGRQLSLRALQNRLRGEKAVTAAALTDKCRTLLSNKGQASGTKLASEILYLYEACQPEERRVFFDLLQSEFGPYEKGLLAACADYTKTPNPDRLAALAKAVESPRQELFRRLNQAPNGTAFLVKMREDLLAELKNKLHLYHVDRDLLHLFRSWFNRGFLVLEEITWSSPALVLERLIAYEAVHEIQGWDDLKNRLAPADRQCYAFFHPSLIDEPLIFVEVALCQNIPNSVQTILSDERDVLGPEHIKTAAFYSISNCQMGLRGISFGNFLIKQVAVDLKTQFPQLDTFVTLSPLPGLRTWLEDEDNRKAYNISAQDWIAMSDDDWAAGESFAKSVEGRILAAAIGYLTTWKEDTGRLLDPVARFHLGNGARIESLQWQANTSEQGLSASLGVMVNYAYELDKVEINHEAFTVNNEIALSPAMKSLLKKKR